MQYSAIIHGSDLLKQKVLPKNEKPYKKQPHPDTSGRGYFFLIYTLKLTE